MRSKFYVISYLFMAVVAFGGLSSCSKGGGDSASTGGSNNNGNGNVSSNGSTVNGSSSTVQGVSLSYQVTDVQMSYSTVYFKISVNGSSLVTLNASSSYTATYNVNQFQVATAFTCYDNQCATMLLGITLTPLTGSYGSTTEYREVAIKKDMQGNSILAVREFQGTNGNLYSLVQLKSML